MGDANVLEALGGEYLTERGPRHWWAVRRDRAADLSAAGFGPASDGTLRASELAGRAPLLELDAGGVRYVVRRFTHGGLLRFATCRRYADPARPFREILCARHLAAHAVRTPLYVAARARRSALFGWELDLASERILDALDLEELLARARAGTVPSRVVSRAASALGRLVRALHDAGFLHADLTTKNVLVNASVIAGASPALTLLDLDRARIVPSPTDAERRDNLRRLWRFVSRGEERAGRALRRTDHARFLRGYEPDRAARQADLRAIARDDERWRVLHAFGWRLESLFRAPGDGRRPGPHSSASTPSDPSRVTRG